MRLGRNDACHCGSGKKYKRCHLTADEAAPSDRAAEEASRGEVLSLPDRRALERTFARFGAMLGGGSARRKRRPVEQAQEVMYDAWEAVEPERRVALARRALDISRDCADAYVLLAEEVASSEAEQEALFTQGVAAGERALGKAAFEEDAGHFWGFHQTRPYMRARAGLAQCLRRRRDLAGAIGHFEDMLRLNPNDNQGVRWELAACLLEAGRDEALGQLLARYDEDGSAAWIYSRALLAFRRGGENADSRAALALARARNPHVCPYLLGAKKLPRDLPRYMGFGDENEAVIYVAEHRGAWGATAGALEWLAAVTRAPARRSAAETARRSRPRSRRAPGGSPMSTRHRTS